MITILSKFIKINNLHVVAVINNEDGEYYNVLTVKKKSSKIEMISASTFGTFEELRKNIDTKLPILLVIDGKGVLNKEIDLNNEADIIWQKNIDTTIIFYTSLQAAKSNFISFCRKSIVENSLAKFKKNRFQIIDIYIGSFLAALLYNAIKKETIISNDLVLGFTDEKMVRFSKQSGEPKKERYTIGKESISSVFLPLYGVLIDFFVHPNEVSKTKDGSLNAEEILYKKAFTFFGAAMLIGFLSTLLLSYFLIQYFGSKNAELNLQNVYSNQSYQLILDLEKEKEKKQNILNESGFLSSKFLTYYGYEISKSVPYDITLNELSIIPINSEIKAGKKMTFDVKKIIVKGETFNESSFNNWMENIKKMNWLQNFEIISLKKDKKNKSQFEVKITIKDV